MSATVNREISSKQRWNVFGDKQEAQEHQDTT